MASQKSVHRLEIAARRAEGLERHISDLESDLDGMQDKLLESEEEKRGAVGMRRKAERSLVDLQDQMDRMEKGAQEEAKRQAEVIARLETQRELNSAAVRLKGAAAVKSIAGAEGSGAVSSFITDLLQDNANLQLGMAELTELLTSSREEIQTLRECLDDPRPSHTHTSTPTPSSLREELGLPVSPPKREEPSREVHIHHHYHAAAPKERKKKRRSALFMTPSSSRAPSVATVESSAKDGAWSPRELEDSLASSPRSDPRMSVFDRPEEPLSPSTSVGALSPSWKGKRPALLPSSPPGMGMLDEIADREPMGLDESLVGDVLDESAPDSGVEVSEMDASEAVPELCVAETDSETPIARSPPRTLRRAQSHESVVSLGGLDIHTLRSRPSQLTLGQIGAQAVLADVTAQPTISRAGGLGSSVLRDSLASLPSSRPAARPAGKRWMWRPWKAVEEEQDDSSVTTGSATVSEEAAPRDIPSLIAPNVKELKDGGSKVGTPKAGSVRAPGINQPGAIPGFGEFMAQARRKGRPSVEGDGP